MCSFYTSINHVQICQFKKKDVVYTPLHHISTQESTPSKALGQLSSF